MSFENKKKGTVYFNIKPEQVVVPSYTVKRWCVFEFKRMQTSQLSSDETIDIMQLLVNNNLILVIWTSGTSFFPQPPVLVSQIAIA